MGHATTTVGTRGDSPLGEENDTTARPRASDRQPGVLQGHHRGPGEARSRTRRDAKHGSEGGLPPLWGGTARKAHAKEAKRECLLRPKGPRPPPLTDTRRQQGGRPEVRLEAAPLPSPTPPAGGGGAARGPRQNERRGPTHHERPSLTWRGLSPSPGERHITTSISPGRAREEPRRGEGGPAKTITTGACFSFTGPPSSSSSSSPSSLRGETAADNPGRENA